MAEEGEYSPIIKTPQQLIAVGLLAFAAPILGIVLLAQLVVNRPHADPAGLAPAAVSARIQPVGKLEFGSAGAASGAARSGEEIVKTVCAGCHQAGVAGAPKLGDKAAWAPKIKSGLEAMLANAIKGIQGMPPRGGGADLSDLELARAIVSMANQSGGNLKEPAVAKK